MVLSLTHLNIWGITGPNERQDPAHNPSPYNAVGSRSDDGAPGVESANPKHNLPEAPTACKRGATVAQLEPNVNANYKSCWALSSDVSDIEIMSMEKLGTSDAKSANSEGKRTTPGAGAHLRSNTRIEAGNSEALKTLPQGIQRSAQRTPITIGDLEGREVADDTSDIVDHLCIALLNDRVRWRGAQRRTGRR